MLMRNMFNNERRRLQIHRVGQGRWARPGSRRRTIRTSLKALMEILDTDSPAH